MHHQNCYHLRPCCVAPMGTNFKQLASRQLLAQHLLSNKHVCHIYDQNGNKQSLDKLLHGPYGQTRWLPTLSNEWGCLSQGNDNHIKYNNCIDFIHKHNVPLDNKSHICKFCLQQTPSQTGRMAHPHGCWRRYAPILLGCRIPCHGSNRNKIII